MKKLVVFLPLMLLLCISNFAQINGSLKLGLSAFQGDLHCRSDENLALFDDLGFSFGAGLRLPLSEVVGLRVEGTYFNLKGSEANFADAGHQARGWSFENKFVELSALLDWEILGKKRFLENGDFRRTLTPVIFGGIGFAFNKPTVDWNNSTNPNINTDEDKSDKAQFVVPVGVGLKYYLSERFALGLEAGVRLPLSDYFDGVSMSANPDLNDVYGFGGAKAYFTIGKKTDTDGDGIVDKKDLCPEVPGIKAFNGCPDSDGDGIADKEDACPKVFGLATFMGCPDTDEDGIIDAEDSCPEVKGLAELAGCPDADGDGLADKDDKCPNAPGTKANNGCPDTDGDGVIDQKDKCPNEAGTIAKEGCPVVDTDGDGIEDEMDSCPAVKGTSATNGCPDKDNDGVADKDDRCPSTAGTIANDGCPKVVAPTTPVRTVVDLSGMRSRLAFASQNIIFQTNSSNLTAQSDKHLNDIVTIMNEYPGQNICINGYTDNVGSSTSNQKLSERRAKATFDFLIAKGISPARMNHTGYGEANPIATNTTKEGRKTNRRVEALLNDGFCAR